jgi:predicted phosphodiesterase
MARTKSRTDFKQAAKKEAADAVIISDPHLRLDNPTCRTDDIIETQRRKWRFIRETAAAHKCPVLCAGDIYNKWNASSRLNVLAMRMMPEEVIAVAGQHDLPGHQLDRVMEAGLGVLVEAGYVKLIGGRTPHETDFGTVEGYNWNDELEDTGKPKFPSIRKVALLHHFVYKGKTFPGAEEVGLGARSVMRKLKSFDLIITGDNHQTFTEEWNGRLLINPGSLIRSTAAQIDHRPSLFLWYAESNTVEQVFIPIEKDVINRDHLDVVSERDERIEAFISRLKHDVEIGFSFQGNVSAFLKKNKIKAGVQDIIWEAMQ